MHHLKATAEKTIYISWINDNDHDDLASIIQPFLLPMMNLFSSTEKFRKFMKADMGMLMLVSTTERDGGKIFLGFHFHCRQQSLKEDKRSGKDEDEDDIGRKSIHDFFVWNISGSCYHYTWFC